MRTSCERSPRDRLRGGTGGRSSDLCLERFRCACSLNTTILIAQDVVELAAGSQISGTIFCTA